MAEKKLGDYQLIEMLGKGNYGAVYRSRRQSGIVTLTYALKILHKSQVEDKLFRTEAESWARVANPPHENVVTLHFADVCDGEYLLVSDFCPDGTLDQWIKEHGGEAPSLEQALALYEGVLRGLAHLHKNQIVHCDLKSANILLQGSTPKLSDFGFARAVKDTVDISKFAGSPRYQSWDVQRRRAQNEPEDVWAAGIILCDLLGFLPFRSVDGILDRHAPQLPDNLSPLVRTFLETALDHERKQRFPNGVDMLAEFQRIRELLQTEPLRAERQRAELADQMAKLALAEKEAAEKVAAETTQRAQATLASAEARERQAIERDRQAQTKLSEAEDNMQTVAQLRLEAEKVKREAEQALEKSKADSDELQTLRNEKQTHDATQAQLLQAAAETTERLQTERDRLKADNEQAQKRIQAAESQVQKVQQEARDAQKTAIPPFFGPALALVSTTALVGVGALGIVITSVPIRVILGGLLLGTIGYVAYCHQKNKRLVQGKSASVQPVEYQPTEYQPTESQSIKISSDQLKFQRHLEAAKSGSAHDMANLGVMYEKGEGVSRDYSEALKWFRKSAEAGNGYGMACLGVMYAAGRGVPQDYAEALKRFRKAAEAGDTYGMANLGVMYENGHGVPRVNSEALKWFRKSAEAGDAYGMTCLGVMYENGNGVVKDLEVAKQWYRKAAKLWNEDAKGHLKRLGEKV